MLILGRREGDTILIEGGIRIVVVSCDRGGVRIGIDAPSTLKILRGEIAQQVSNENQRATAISADALLAMFGSASVAEPSSAALLPVGEGASS